MTAKGNVSYPWGCRHCRAVIIPGYDEIREISPRPPAGSFAVCGECWPEPWWSKATAAAEWRDEK